MTLEEKTQVLTISFPNFVQTAYVGGFRGIERLNIPDIKYNDGPQGFRSEMTTHGSSTAFPCLLTLTMSWNPDLVERMGIAMGKEFRTKGAHVLLGPGVNILRVPYNGRNFEYLGGEDPVLAGSLTGPMIRGI